MSQTVVIENLISAEYIQTPLSLFDKRLNGGKRLAISTIFIAGQIFSYSKSGNICNSTYERFSRILHRSHATVGRALKQLKNLNIVKRRRMSGYSFNSEELATTQNKGLYITTQTWLANEKFIIRNKERYLKNSEVAVYSYIYSSCKKRKNNIGYCITSNAELSAALGIDEKTINKAIWELLRAGLIYRNQKGINGSLKSIYTINNKLVLAHRRKKRVKKEIETLQSSEDLAAQQKIAAKAAEQEAKEQEFNRIERNRRRAYAFTPFKTADKKYSELAIKLAFAEVKNPEQVAAIKKEYIHASKERLKALSDIGLNENDITFNNGGTDPPNGI